MTRSILLGIGLGLLLGLVFTAGFLLHDVLDTQPSLAAADASASYALLDEVQALIDRFYVREQPDYRSRQYAAIRGMLTSLNDPYTFFVEPSTAASESDVLAGTYGGVGVQVVRGSVGEYVLYPFAGGPAAAAGVLAEDRLVAVNGAALDPALSLDVVDQLLRGEVKPGNGVELTLLRGDVEERIFVEFAVIDVPSVVWRMFDSDQRLGYLQIMRFSARTPDELAAAADGLREAGARGLVVDVRDNAGGLLQETIEVADAFVDEGPLVYEVSASGEREYTSTAGGALVGLPVVVLINGRTASGAEILAGAIRDAGRGVLIGEPTYGKGTVQQILPLSDTSSLHVTSSEWLTPARRPLDQIGLEPDFLVPASTSGPDAVLMAGVDLLDTELAPRGAGS